MNKGYFHGIAGSLTLFICVSVQAASSYTYTTLDVDIDGVTVSHTRAFGIDGSNIVGFYVDGSGDWHGFQATLVPLPTSAWMGLALLGGIGGYGLIRRRLCSVNTPL